MSITTTIPVVTQAQYEAVKPLLLERLQKELPPQLTYHSVGHTKDVLAATSLLMEAENLPVEQGWLLLTAALFHDSGFLRHHQNHEELSCDIAWEMLPGFGFSNEAIEHICRLIMATRLPQSPASHLEQILCDADLFYLGGPAFFRGAEALYKEWKALGLVAGREAWEEKQLLFLEGHRYFTATADAQRTHQKLKHLQQLRRRWRRQWSRGWIDPQIAGYVTDALYLLSGAAVAAFALKSFLEPNAIFDGGVTGISLLIEQIYHHHLGLVILLANLPFAVAGYFWVGRSFAIKTMVCVALLAVCLLFIPFPPIKTPDTILIAFFGGFFLGTGIGLCMRAGCALDGIEVLALKTFRRTPFTVTEIILVLNIVIFLLAALHFDILKALYSILTFFTATKAIDFVVEGIEAYTGVTIISADSDLLKHRLVNEMGKGITVYKGERGFLPGRFETSAPCDIIFTVVTRLELRRLKTLVHETDPKAFVFASTIREASGGILRRRSSHHA